MDSDNLITAMKELYDYFHNKQQSTETMEIINNKAASFEEKVVANTNVIYHEGAKDALRLLARNLELNVDYTTLERK